MMKYILEPIAFFAFAAVVFVVEVFALVLAIKLAT